MKTKKERDKFLDRVKDGDKTITAEECAAHSGMLPQPKPGPDPNEELKKPTPAKDKPRDEHPGHKRWADAQHTEEEK